MAVSQSEGLPSLRDLASSEPKARRAALQTVSAYLTSPNRPTLTPTDCLQLWRAFTVALLMHDSKNAISVQNLISTLAQQFRAIAERDDGLRAGADVGTGDGGQELVTFTLAFWETMAREYTNVDALRMDKILLLIRMSVREQFRLIFEEASDMTDDSSSTETLDILITAFEKFPLSVRERKVPDGVRYHVLDLWVEVLDLVRSEHRRQAAEDRAHEDATSNTGLGNVDGRKDNGIFKAIEKLMSLIPTLAKDSPTKQVRIHAKDAIAAAVEKGLLQSDSTT